MDDLTLLRQTAARAARDADRADAMLCCLLLVVTLAAFAVAGAVLWSVAR